MTDIIKKLKTQFVSVFGENDEKLHSFFSPSRINIIGEHIDYNGGKVFPCAISVGTYGVARKNNDNKFRLYSLNLSPGLTLDKKDLNAYNEENKWANYVMGMVKFIKEEGYNIGGFDLIVYGNIPNGSGLSSSASLELLVGQVVNSLYNDKKIPVLDLIKIGKRTENEFIGVQTGIMDQFIIGVGKKDNAVLIDTNSLEYEYFPFVLEGYKIVILNTNKRRELKDSKYNERRAECEEGLKILKEHIDIENLCQLEEKDFDVLTKIRDSIIRKRVKHVVEEMQRVLQATEALKENNIVKLGQLLNESDKSLKDLYEVTGEHLDSITKHSREFDGCVGARMTGAGFGGCGIAIVKEEKVDDFIKQVSQKYKKDTGIAGEFIIASVDDGARELEGE